MKKLNFTLLLSLLGLLSLKAQIYDINTLKYSCGNRTDNVNFNTTTYKLTKDSVGMVFSSRFIKNSNFPSLIPYQFTVYYNDTLSANLLYTQVINSSIDSFAVNYSLTSLMGSGDYFFKFNFANSTGNYRSITCVKKLLSPTVSCATSTCQLIANDDLLPVTTGTFDPVDPYPFGVVPCWNDAWGTPQIDLTGYAKMWHGRVLAPSGLWYVQGEGIMQNLSTPLVAGQQYVMSLDAAALTSVTVDNFYATLTNSTTSGLPIITGLLGDPIPPFSGQNVIHGTALNGGFYNYSKCFTATSNFNQLVIYPQQTIGTMPVGWLGINSIRIYKVTPQAESYTLTCASPTVQIGNFDCNISATYYNWTPTVSLSHPYILNPIANPSVTTIYTLSIIPNLGGCPITYTTTVYVQPPAPVTISASPSIINCPGTPVTLMASGASTYTWLPSGDVGSVLTVSPTVETTYTLNYIDAFGCSSNTLVTLFVYPTPPLSITNTSVSGCPSPSNLLTAIGGASGFVWYPMLTTGVSVAVSPTVPTIYTVTALSADGCNLSGTILVNPTSCCSIHPGTPFTQTSGSLTGSGYYFLNSPITLTSNLSLTDVTIFMGSNAEIIVPNNFKLTLDKCHFLGCPIMWKGIRCSGLKGTVILKNNTLIEDAITAIDVANVLDPSGSGMPYIVNIQDATFNKNLTAINIKTYNSTTGNFPMYMQNTVITSRKLITPQHVALTPSLAVTYNWPTSTNLSSLKNIATFPSSFIPDSHLQTNYEFSVATYSSSNLEVPHTTSTAHQGIYVQDVYSPTNYNGLRIGASATTFTSLNLFDNMHYGINGLNANIYSSNAAYQYMQQYQTGGGKIKTHDGGIGIHSISNIASGIGSGSAQTFSLTVLPTSMGYNKSTNFFINCAYGVKFTNIEFANIQYSIYHSKRVYSPPGFIIVLGAPVAMGEYGVYAKTVDYRNININNNFTANIKNSIVFIADFDYVTKKIGSQYAGALNIRRNTLKANYGLVLSTRSLGHAIAVDNLLNQTTIAGYVVGTPTVPIFVANNTIDKAFIGITVTNWNFQRVIDNSNTITLVDNLAPTYTQYGIDHYNNTNDNMIGNTIKGFNTTKINVYGIVGAQNQGQTMWCNSTENTYRGISFYGSHNLTSWKENKMKTHIWGMELNQTTIGTQGAPFQPINNQWLGAWGTGTYKTFVNTLDPALSVPNSNLYLSNVPTPTQNGAFGGVGISYKTSPPQSLFYTTGFSGVYCPVMPLLSSLGYSGSSSLSAFIGNLTNIVSNVYTYGNFTNSNRKNGKIAVYKALLDDSTLATGNVILQNFASTNNSSAIGKLVQAEAHLVNGNITLAQSAITSVLPTDSVEQNTKRFYEIYVKTKTNAYTTSDDTDLQALANGCPQRDGSVVYQARVLLNSIYDVYYHYNDNCPDGVSTARLLNNNDGEETEMVASNFIVYPNPSAGTIYFSASNLGISNYEVTIYDVNGKIVYQKEYGINANEINTIHLNFSNGVYLMHLKDNSTNNVYKQKIVIQK